jgi:hypothetical protein
LSLFTGAMIHSPLLGGIYMFALIQSRDSCDSI